MLRSGAAGANQWCSGEGQSAEGQEPVGRTLTDGEDSVHMDVATTRFGMVQVENDRVLEFSGGLLGFSSFTRFVLLQPDPEGRFLWLQSVDSPDLAFVVTDPSHWCDDFEAVIRREHLAQLSLDSVDEARILVIVNKYDDALTANLQGPLIVNIKNRRGMQVVLADRRWTTRRQIAKLVAQQQRISA
ncbi:MAG: flagellar assembly protein FliW [Phycisphaerales bacterium]|nr:flagellar assembly protein FliW [Phycisphaerales bacterium]